MIDTKAFYNGLLSTEHNADAQYPFTKSIREDSPLARVTTSGSLGADFQPEGSHAVNYDYRENRSGEVKKFRIVENATGTESIQLEGTYAFESLTVNEVVESSEKTIQTFNDAEGKVVLERVTVPEGNTDVYYCYNDLGQLRYILPANSTENIEAPDPGDAVANGWEEHYDDLVIDHTTNIGSKVWVHNSCKIIPNFTHNAATDGPLTIKAVDASPPGVVDFNLVYRNEYDNQRRLVASRVPGADWVYHIYDKLGRMVMSQDGNLRKDNLWSFVKYDCLSRPIISGIMAITGKTRSQIQSEFDDYAGSFSELNAREYAELSPGSSAGFDSGIGYTLNFSYPVNYATASADDVLAVNYYDSYDFPDASLVAFDPDPNFNISGYEDIDPVDNGYNDYVQGRLLASKTRILDDHLSDPAQKSSFPWVVTANYFDDRGNAIQMVTNVNDGAINDYQSGKYNFAGQMLEGVQQQALNNIVSATVHSRNLLLLQTFMRKGRRG